MNGKRTIPGFGLIIIGTEILDGRRQDKHFEVCRRLLMERNLLLAYTLVLSDEPRLLESQLRWGMQRPEPFFCCGGIGSTPDDYTRACAGAAAGVPLELHAEGVEILKSRFGDRATPARLDMVRFPRGSVLVPNPINHVPGFSISNGYFLPGFPEMAAPMMAWVLDEYYCRGEARKAHAVVIEGAREADLVDLMRDFMAAHPAVSFSSLPRFSELELGISGPVTAADAALADLLKRLETCSLSYTSPGEVKG